MSQNNLNNHLIPNEEEAIKSSFRKKVFDCLCFCFPTSTNQQDQEQPINQNYNYQIQQRTEDQNFVQQVLHNAQNQEDNNILEFLEQNKQSNQNSISTITSAPRINDENFDNQIQSKQAISQKINCQNENSRNNLENCQKSDISLSNQVKQTIFQQFDQDKENDVVERKQGSIDQINKQNEQRIYKEEYNFQNESSNNLNDLSEINVYQYINLGQRTLRRLSNNNHIMRFSSNIGTSWNLVQSNRNTRTSGDTSDQVTDPYEYNDPKYVSLGQKGTEPCLI
ncbi:hypothetical protein ABPG72_019103 [Tetrahymena utriculariae]